MPNTKSQERRVYKDPEFWYLRIKPWVLKLDQMLGEDAPSKCLWCKCFTCKRPGKFQCCGVCVYNEDLCCSWPPILVTDCLYYVPGDEKHEAYRERCAKYEYL